MQFFDVIDRNGDHHEVVADNYYAEGDVATFRRTHEATAETGWMDGYNVASFAGFRMVKLKDKGLTPA